MYFNKGINRSIDGVTVTSPIEKYMRYNEY